MCVCIFVTDQLEDSDQTKVVVGVVVGLLVATVVIGLAYWVYMKKSKYVNTDLYTNLNNNEPIFGF